jgi:hypothetical protein
MLIDGCHKYGGGVGMSPWRMMVECGIPYVMDAYR